MNFREIMMSEIVGTQIEGYYKFKNNMSIFHTLEGEPFYKNRDVDHEFEIEFKLDGNSENLHKEFRNAIHDVIIGFVRATDEEIYELFRDKFHVHIDCYINVTEVNEFEYKFVFKYTYGGF